jgi:ferredoxin-NADP reductase
VYACGNPAMTAAVQAELTTRAGLAPDRFHADAFLPTGDAEPVSTG